MLQLQLQLMAEFNGEGLSSPKSKSKFEQAPHRGSIALYMVDQDAIVDDGQTTPLGATSCRSRFRQALEGLG